MLSGRSPVASGGICRPHCPYIPPSPHPLHPPPPPSEPVAGVADWLTSGLSRQMAAMTALRDWSGSGLQGARPSTCPQGG